MSDNELKDKIYTPYTEAWKIIKLLQFAGVGGFRMEQVDDYWQAVDRFEKQFAGNKFAELLLKSVLLHVDNIIIRLNEEEGNK